MEDKLPLLTADGAVIPGTPEHATAIAGNRFPGVRDALQWLTYSHLPPALRRFSEPFYTAAVGLLREISVDSPELTTALNGLIVAKDSAMRAGIRSDTGRTGSVPRPQAVVDPPQLAPACLNCGRPEGVPHAPECHARGAGTGFVPGSLA